MRGAIIQVRSCPFWCSHEGRTALSLERTRVHFIGVENCSPAIQLVEQAPDGSAFSRAHTASFCGEDMRDHIAISSRVRWQPVQVCFAASSRHCCTQGEGTEVSRGCM